MLLSHACLFSFLVHTYVLCHTQIISCKCTHKRDFVQFEWGFLLSGEVASGPFTCRVKGQLETTCLIVEATILMPNVNFSVSFTV